MHHYFFCLCSIYAIIAIKNDFVIYKHSLGPSESVEYALFSTLPWDLENVNEWKIIFDPYIPVVMPPTSEEVEGAYWFGSVGAVQ